MGFQDSRIIKCLFIKFKNVAGKVVTQALVALHVDDAMLAGDDTCAPLWEALKPKLTFGVWENLRDKPTKFCGRFLHRVSDTEVESDIDFYTQTVHGIKLEVERKKDLEAPVSPADCSALQKVNGQLN